MRGITFLSVVCSTLLAGPGCGSKTESLDSEKNEFRFECKVLPLPSGTLRVTGNHCVDSGPGYHYEYDIIEVEAAGVVYVARSYVGEPSEVHFLAKESDGKRAHLSAADVASKSFQQAVLYFRNRGKTHVNYLSVQHDGYVPVPP